MDKLVYFELLLQADDNDLKNMCSLNKMTGNICRSDYFWKQRSEWKKPHIVANKPEDITWSQWYRLN